MATVSSKVTFLLVGDEAVEAKANAEMASSVSSLRAAVGDADASSSSSSSWSSKKRWKERSAAISQDSSEDAEHDAEMEGSERTRRLLMRGLLIAEHMDATLREELLPPPLLVVARDGLLDDVIVVVVDAVPNERVEASSGPVSVEGNLITCGRHRFMGFAEILMLMSATFIMLVGRFVGRNSLGWR